ncbi:hypothetical protein [Vibrio owensii]|uniref:hypothetical protein n=1 Tax=Vibrio harveyi group TaxID=717610 RepID=UPI003CC6B7A2
MTTVKRINDIDFSATLNEALGLNVQLGDVCKVPFSKIAFERRVALGKPNKDNIQSIRNDILAGKKINSISVHAATKDDELVLRVVCGIDIYKAIEKVNKDAPGTVEEVTVQFISSDAIAGIYHYLEENTGKTLSAVTRGTCYESLIELGETQMSIAERLSISQAGISNHMMLARSGEKLCDLVDTGKLKQSMAISLVRKHGPEKALEVARMEIEHQRDGKAGSPLSKTQMSNDSIDMVMTQLLEIRSSLQAAQKGEPLSLTVSPEQAAILLSLADEAANVVSHNTKADEKMRKLGLESAGQGFVPSKDSNAGRKAA